MAIRFRRMRKVHYTRRYRALRPLYGLFPLPHAICRLFYDICRNWWAINPTVGFRHRPGPGAYKHPSRLLRQLPARHSELSASPPNRGGSLVLGPSASVVWLLFSFQRKVLVLAFFLIEAVENTNAALVTEVASLVTDVAGDKHLEAFLNIYP